MRKILGQAITVKGEEGSEQDGETLAEPSYEAFRSVEDLTETAQALYKAAGKLLRLFHIISRANQSSRSHIRPFA
jgi:hypothetical protein